MTAPARRRLARLLLVLVALLAPLLLFEAVLRVLDPSGYADFEAREVFSAQLLEGRGGMLRTRPGVATKFRGSAVVTDARGLRTPAFAVPKPAGTLRVLALGDSVVFGWGVAEEEAFPRLLEKALRAEGRGDVEIVNAGSPGWGLPEEWKWLTDEGMALEPDVVLHCVIANDVQAVPKPPRAWLGGRLRKVRVLRFAEDLWAKWTMDPRPDPKTGVSDEQLCWSLDLMQKTCAEKGIRYVFLDTIGVAKAREHCAQVGIARVDLFLSQEWVNAHQQSASDFHPNAAGHRYIAERVLPQLRRLLRP